MTAKNRDACGPRLRQAMAAHIWHSDRSPALQRAFRRRVATVTRRFIGIAALIAIALLILSWPMDYLAFHKRGPAALLWHLTEWRLILVGWLLVVLLGFHTLPRWTFGALVALSTVAFGMLGMSVGKIGGLGTNFFYTLYLIPFTAILVLVPIVARIALTLAFAAACVAGYLVMDPGFLTNPYLPTALAVLVVGSGLSIVIGHLFYDLVRVGHFCSRALEAEQLRSKRLLERLVDRTTAELQRQVAERSRDLGSALAKLAQQPQRLIGTDRVIDRRYRVVRRLGAGGMGMVYEVARLDDGRRLALKTLRGRVDAEAMARFAREAEIAAGLDHPNLVSVIDLGVTEGELFLVMEMVSGGSLEAERARFGDRRWAEPLLGQIARGLAAIHERGIVHRDLKPSNILLGGGVARIADFGLASLGIAADADTAASGGGFLGVTAPRLTRPGDLFGTADYMAPELASGVVRAAPSCDIFAFGVLAFELVAGRAPFAEPPVLARMHGRSIARPRLDHRHGALIERCLDLDPARRPTATELVAELGNAARVAGHLRVASSARADIGGGATLRPV